MSKLMGNPKIMEFLKDPNYMKIMSKMHNPTCEDIFETAKAYPGYITLIAICLNESEPKIKEDVKTYFMIKNNLSGNKPDFHIEKEDEKKDNSSHYQNTEYKNSTQKEEKEDSKSKEKGFKEKDKEIDVGLNHYNTGNELYMWGRYKDAIKEFQSAVKLDKTNFKYFYSRALCHYKLKEYYPCNEACEKVINLLKDKNDNLDLLLNIYILNSKSLNLIGDSDEADLMFKRAFKTGDETMHEKLQTEYEKFKNKQK